MPIPPMEQPGEDVLNRNRPQRQQHRLPSPQQERQVTDLANRMKDIFKMESAGGASAGPSDPTVDGNVCGRGLHFVEFDLEAATACACLSELRCVTLSDRRDCGAMCMAP